MGGVNVYLLSTEQTSTGRWYWVSSTLPLVLDSEPEAIADEVAQEAEEDLPKNFLEAEEMVWKLK